MNENAPNPSALPQLDPPPHRRHRRVSARSRILRSTAVLPALATILNGLSGFAAIHFATKDPLGGLSFTNLGVAAWLILIAMVFDMLDGRLARMTRKTSDFGAQLDSLSDMVSFGVAPAVLMLRVAASVMRDHGAMFSFGSEHLTQGALERVVWCVAAVYMACAALRLARFNVENEPDESAHMSFRGLPSPGAAATVTTMVMLFGHLAPEAATQINSTWQYCPWLMMTVGIALPLVTLAVGLLMVSRFRYPHVVNQYIRGKRPFSYLVKLVVVLTAVLLYPYVTGAFLMLVYALWGPVGAIGRKVRRSKAPASIPPPQAG